MSNFISLNLGNFYGTVVAYEENGKYFLGLDNYDGMNKIEISEKFYKDIQNEFSVEY